MDMPASTSKISNIDIIEQHEDEYNSLRESGYSIVDAMEQIIHKFEQEED